MGWLLGWPWGRKRDWLSGVVIYRQGLDRVFIVVVHRMKLGSTHFRYMYTYIIADPVKLLIE